MKNKELYKLFKKNKFNTNSGFTLTELLIGLFMSIFVIGALGFGLMTVLSTTQSENSKVRARNENSRALDFISDEVRRARTIDTDLSNARVTTSTTDLTAFNVTSTNIDSSTGAFNSNTSTNKKIVFALNIPEVSSSDTLGADADASTTERIIYFLKSASGTNWKGPSVLYRWGPPLRANGNYADGDWTEQALIDGIDNTHIATSPCATGGILTPPRLTGTAPTLTGSALSTAATGFYACITGMNTAQLYLTGQTKTASGVNDSQTNDSKVVARARETLPNQTNIFNSVTWSFNDIGGRYNCNASTEWNMRTYFGTNTSDLNASTTPWDRDTSKQPQPIAIDTSKPLVITSSPTGGATKSDGSTDCSSRGNLGAGTLDLNNANTIKVSHAINFGNPITFNGDREGGSYNNSEVDSTKPTVKFLKRGTDVPVHGAYDADGDGVITIPRDANGDGIISVAEGLGSPDQPSLGRFLFDQGLAIPKNGADPFNKNTEFTIPTSSESLQSFLASTYGLALTPAEKQKFKLVGEDQRIIAFEVGQNNPNVNNDGQSFPNDADGNPGKNPGFDLQDNIFVVTSDVFRKEFPANCFPSGCPAS